ncbi:hypothetical protein B0T12DRAFT_391408 [Alternaria alternata]|nr:hypothetical protein B0T12DRAFT_391408 [Alternaria alternata]
MPGWSKSPMIVTYHRMLGSDIRLLDPDPRDKTVLDVIPPELSRSSSRIAPVSSSKVFTAGHLLRLVSDSGLWFLTNREKSSGSPGLKALSELNVSPILLPSHWAYRYRQAQPPPTSSIYPQTHDLLGCAVFILACPLGSSSLLIHVVAGTVPGYDSKGAACAAVGDRFDGKRSVRCEYWRQRAFRLGALSRQACRYMSTGQFLLAISPVCVAVERVMSNDKDRRPVKKGLRCTSQESALPCRRLEQCGRKKEGKLAGGPLGGLDAARLSMSAVSYGCLLKSGIPFLSGTQEVARFTIFRKRLESTYEYRFAKPPNGHKRLDTLAVGQHNKRP